MSSRTVFIIHSDEADGSFDHRVPPTPPQSLAEGASTVSIENELLTTADPVGPIGRGWRFRRGARADRSSSATAGAALLTVDAQYGKAGSGSLKWRVSNASETPVLVQVLDAYSGRQLKQAVAVDAAFEHEWSLQTVHGWYDLVVTVGQDAGFTRRLAGHVETGRDSYTDPALGGLVTLKT